MPGISFIQKGTMKIYTKLVWEWDEEKGLIEKESECFDYEGPLVRCDSDDSGGDNGGDSDGGGMTAEEQEAENRAQAAYEAQVYAQRHGTLDGSGYENDPFLQNTTRQFRTNDPDGGSGGGGGTAPTNPGSSGPPPPPPHPRPPRTAPGTRRQAGRAPTGRPASPPTSPTSARRRTSCARPRRC